MPIIKIFTTLVELPRVAKKTLVISIDILLCFVVSWMAFCLRFEQFVPLNEQIYFSGSISSIIAVPIFARLGLYRAIFRYNGWYSTLSIIKAASIYTLLYSIIFTLIGVLGVPRSIGIIQPVLYFVGVGATRLLAKLLLNWRSNKTLKFASHRQALIYGAGSSGRQIASGLRQTNEIKAVGFIDDDVRLWGAMINGLPVYSPDQLEVILNSNRRITDVLLAIPTARRSRIKEILTTLSELPVHVRTLPGLSHLANGIVKVEDIREVEIEDVLGRDSVDPNLNLLKKGITEKVILITGAGGSIGSEICRQIVGLSPKILILFESSEVALYAIERELSSFSHKTKIIPVLGSVLNEEKLLRLMRQFCVQKVFHAAAYKHVPMIEINPAAGILNNVFGTLRVLNACCEASVETLVLISTDKAVRPTNIMGCTKRIAELLLQARSLQQADAFDCTTKLTMVRFGNVLGSSGSVVPLFKKQIKNGGPVTVTHPEIIRYFMTIPEAAQLVIQAGEMSDGGDVMVLDMGEPVTILELAKRMIHLSGFTHKDKDNPDGDIEIQFTGLRPGEKLFEELLIGGNVFPTSHSRIMRAVEHALNWDDLKPILDELEIAVQFENYNDMISLLQKAVPEFNPDTKNISFN